MNDREMMLKRLSSAQFAAWELRVFLDTHPNNKDAFTMYQKYLKKAAKLKDEFEDKFGPLSNPDSFEGGSWSWNDNPWPWETEKEVY